MKYRKFSGPKPTEMKTMCFKQEILRQKSIGLLFYKCYYSYIKFLFKICLHPDVLTHHSLSSVNFRIVTQFYIDKILTTVHVRK